MYLAALLLCGVAFAHVLQTGGRTAAIVHGHSSLPVCDRCGRDPLEVDLELQREANERQNRRASQAEVLLAASFLLGVGLALSGKGPWWPLGALLLLSLLVLPLGRPIPRELGGSGGPGLLSCPCSGREGLEGSGPQSFLR